MGFYGNITNTNTNKTQFTFDRTYPNRKTMETRLATDEIYLGRYVLIEYDTVNDYTLDSYLKCYMKIGDSGLEEFYTSPNFENNTRVKWSKPVETDTTLSNLTPSIQNTVTSKQLIYIDKDLTPDDTNHTISHVFYQCTNAVDSADGAIATFRYIVPSETPYTSNYNIDTATYGPGRGYDSTVWQKVYMQNTEKYVMIAELNTVVPTFDLVADAPTMEPITPHFDANSTNVYYKLHWQPQWGLRIAEETDMNKNSDGNARWISTSYDPATDIIHTTTRDDVRAAINFNGPAFDPQVNKQGIINKHDDSTNQFTILPTGKSGQLYSTHDGTGEFEQKPDIQEIRVNLPAIGNMMSDAWDIIHGPNRNNDSAKSLQGRLNFFKNMSAQEIPVQSAGGYLVGSTVTGDAWIQPTVDVKILEGDSQYHQNAITVVHTYDTKNKGKELTTFSCKNGSELEEGLTSGLNHGKGDTLKLYTPQIDEMGHVIGNTIETVTLPFGYKKYKTSGLEESTDDLYTSIIEDVNGAHTSTVSANSSDTSANETQDTLTVAPGNKWIQTKFDEDKLTIAHEIHAIPTNSNNPTTVNTEDGANNENNINIPDWKYDKAGHIIEKHDHYYTLPFGYKTITPGNASTLLAEITSNNTSIIADKTQDTLIIAPGNKWVRIAGDNSNDTLTIAHEVHEIEKAAKDPTSLDGVGTFTLYDLVFDEAGHVTANQAHDYTFPYAIRNISVKGSEVVTEGTTVEGTVEADAYNYTLNLNAQNKWINLKVDNGAISIGHAAAGTTKTSANLANNNTQTPNFGSTFKVLTAGIDEMGHVKDLSDYAITLPKPSLNDLIATGSSVLTGISMTDTTGAITQTNANVGTLKLTDYAPITAVSNGAILATDSLNEAIGKLEFRINDLDVKPITADSYSFISEISETDGRIAAKTALLDGVKLKATPVLTNTDTIAADDTLISALGKLQAQINSNANAIQTLDEGIDPDKIDSVKDLITYTEEHGETTKGILDAIGEKSAENSPSTGIYALIDAETSARALADQDINQKIDNLVKVTNEQIEQWNTAEENVQADWAETDTTKDSFILNKPTNLVTEDSTFTYRALIDKAGTEITGATSITILTLLDKIAELEERIYALEHPDTPTEEPIPEEGEEETPAN